MRCLPIVALTTALILAGCLGDGAPDLEAANRELIDDARSAIGDDAALYIISGVEPSEPIPAEQTDGCGTIAADKNPGDGKASAWIYAYGSPANEQALTIATDAKGKVLCEMEEDFWYQDAEPLDSWSVDSVEAARTIANNVEDFKSRVQGAEVFMTLAQTEDGPTWNLGIFNAETDDHGSWAVHAETQEFIGDLTDVWIVEEPTPQMPPENGIASGTTTGTALATTGQPARFSLDNSHGALELTVTSDDPLAELGQRYDVQVYDPNGDSHYFEEVANGEMFILHDANRGEWEVLAFPVAAADASFIVNYCAYTDQPCEGPDAGEDPRFPLLSFL